MGDARCARVGAAPGGSADTEVLGRARAGDRGAWDELYRGYRDRVYTLCLNLVGSREEAQDLLQETFLRAFRGLPGFRGQSQLGTWLYRIAVNAAHDRRRRQRPQERLEPEQAAETPDVAMVEQVRAALATMRAPHRTVLALHYGQGLTGVEIAECLGWSLSRVKVTMHRARRAFREAFLADEE